MSSVRRTIGRVVGILREDLDADPYLPYLLALAAVTYGFGVWFRVPNFAEPDEYSRLLQPMKVAGEFAADPGPDAVIRGLTDGRALGATAYLYAVVLLPVFLAVLATGQLGEFVGLGSMESRWTLWHAVPGWFWSSAVILGRLVSLAFGVGCVYLTYRLGVELKDRFAGRLAALSLALSVGFLAQTHMVGEDAPMLFFLLATVLLANRYVRTGRAAPFLTGALTGGLAIAFKLSGGAAVVVLGVAVLLRTARSDEDVAMVQSRLVLAGLTIGAATVYVGIPSALVGGPSELIARVTGQFGAKTGRTGSLEAPLWYWLLRGYAGGLGLPLAVGAAAALVTATARSLRRRERPASLALLLVSGLVVFPLVYSRWSFVRVRHLVPTFPFVLALVGAEVSRLRGPERRWPWLRIALAAVLVSTAAFAGTAQYGYVTEPRDRATAWLAGEADENETVEVYENSIADVAVPHGQATSHYGFQEEQATNVSSLVLNESAFTDWMLGMPERRPAYVQLTDAELKYTDPTSPDSQRYPERRAFVRSLYAGEYNYTVAAEFGRRPTAPTLWIDFRESVTSPQVDGQASYVVIFERTDPGGEGAGESRETSARKPRETSARDVSSN